MHQKRTQSGESTHPKINLQIPRAAKLPIAHLERHSHLIVLMQHLMEAFALMGSHLDIVSESEDAAHEGGEEE